MQIKTVASMRFYYTPWGMAQTRQREPEHHHALGQILLGSTALRWEECKTRHVGKQFGSFFFEMFL